MAYDSARGVTVLFGGVDQQGKYDSSTFEFDGVSWQKIDVPGPSGRQESAMAYDSSREVVVLFGGRRGDNRRGDTWEWNGISWSLRATGGPSPRGGHAMAYDSDRGVTVLFGGDGQPGNDTWEWDGVSWIRAAAGGVPGRVGPAMIYDAERAVTVLFGGARGMGFLGDTWLWDGAQWLPQVVEGPPARTQAGFAFDEVAGVALLYGGDDIYGEGESLRDMWQWDGAHWSEIVLSSDPGPRNEMGMVYDSQRQVTVLHSGLDEAGPPPFFFYKDTWEYDSTPVTSLVTCQNLTTAQTIQFSTTGSSWDCAAAGLKVSPGDLVQQAVRESRVD